MEYYGCKKCKTFIASSDQFFNEFPDSITRSTHTAENVTIKPTRQPTAEVFCNNPECKKKLGHKLIKPVDQKMNSDAHLVGKFFFMSKCLVRIDPPVQPQPVQPGGVAGATSSNINSENVTIKPTRRRTAKVICNGPNCKKLLGHKLIEAENPTEDHLVGKFIFMSNRLKRIAQPVQPGGVA